MLWVTPDCFVLEGGGIWFRVGCSRLWPEVDRVDRFTFRHGVRACSLFVVGGFPVLLPSFSSSFLFLTMAKTLMVVSGRLSCALCYCAACCP